MEYGVKPNGEQDRHGPGSCVAASTSQQLTVPGTQEVLRGLEWAGSLQESPHGVTARTQSSTRGRCAVDLP